MKSLHQPAPAGNPVVAESAKFMHGDAALERVMEADRRFFERRPYRRFRVRRAYAVEGVPVPPPGKAIFIAVRRVAPGLQARVPFGANATFEPDLLNEAEAAAWFAFAMTGEVR